MINRRHFIASAAGIATVMAAGMMPALAEGKGLVGISMPTKSSTRWISDGESMVKEFTALGYDTDLQYAEDDIPNQLAQIENMVTKGAKVLIVAAIDGTTLSDILKKANESGAKVIAYDRLIRDSGNVDYYSTFDNFKVGVLQADSLVAGLKERFPGVKPWNVELFGGSPDDNNAFFFYDGAMSVLQPMIDAGEIVVPSGQMGMDKVGTLRWDGAVAQSRMDNLLSANYTDKKVHAVLSPYDGLSRGIISSLKGVGYAPGARDADRHRPGRRSRIRQGDAGRRAVFDRVQGHARTGQDHGRHGRRGDAGQGTCHQRHEDLQQRREGGSVQPAGALFGGQGRHPEDAGRLRLHQGRRTAVSI